MKKQLESLAASTSIVQSILVSLGLLIGGAWALYTYLAQEDKENRFSPDVHVEHEILLGDNSNTVYLQVYLVVKNTSVSNLEFKLNPATAILIDEDREVRLLSKPTSETIVIHPRQIMRYPYLFQIRNKGIYLITVSLPLNKEHLNYLIKSGKAQSDAESFSFSASKYIYAGA